METNATSAAFATIVAEIATLPICTIKTNYQNTNLKISQCVQQIYSHHGIAGFYKASLVAIVSQTLSTTLKYTGYEVIKSKYSDVSKPFIGLISGITSSIITHPIDVIKIHYQMQTPILPVIKENGLSLFYRGYSKTFAKVSISSMCFFPLYDKTREFTGNNFSAAFISAIISTTIMQPVDYMKVRHIYGLTFTNNYFKGLSLNLARVVPHFVITMITVEQMKELINKYK